MNREQTAMGKFIELKPVRRIKKRPQHKRYRKPELTDVVGGSLLALATAIANAVIHGLEYRERLKLQRFVILIISAAVTGVGLIRLMMQLVKGW